jgi:Nif-specific regulatory protein
MNYNHNEKLEMTALYEISKILGSSLNLKANLRGVMKVLSEYLDMKRGTVALRSGDEVSIVVAYGMSEEEIKRGKYKLGEGIIGRVAKLGSPIVIPNIGDEPLFLNKTRSRALIKKENIAFLCVPLKYKGDVLGVLSVDRLFGSKGISFEKDLRLLKIISSLIAQAVKLHLEIEKERNALIEEKNALEMELKKRYRVENIIGQSDRMQEVFEIIHRVSPSKANILLLGESGTGKELVAKAIHYMSSRSGGPFIKFNCASIPEGLLESELFGHEKGAFTGANTVRKGRFELAHNGTIFLDEIGDLPLNLQPKILRVLQEREFERVGGEKTIKVNVRIIAATSRDLEQLVKEGRFREDLYYRLNVIPIILPPLRERREDIPLLVEHFLIRFNKENHKSVKMSSDAIDLLMDYDWPGNVRELENTLERLVIMSKENVITASDIPSNIRDRVLKQKLPVREMDALPATVYEIERARIIEALNKTGGNQSKAAKILGLTQRQIGYKIKKYKIDLSLLG